MRFIFQLHLVHYANDLIFFYILPLRHLNTTKVLMEPMRLAAAVGSPEAATCLPTTLQRCPSKQQRSEADELRALQFPMYGLGFGLAGTPSSYSTYLLLIVVFS